MNILQKAKKVESKADELRRMYSLLASLKKSPLENDILIKELREGIKTTTYQLARELVNSKAEIERILNGESEDK